MNDLKGSIKGLIVYQYLNSNDYSLDKLMDEIMSLISQHSENKGERLKDIHKITKDWPKNNIESRDDFYEQYNP